MFKYYFNSNIGFNKKTFYQILYFKIVSQIITQKFKKYIFKMKNNFDQGNDENNQSSMYGEVSKITQELFESTSMHGLSNIAANESIIFKLIWIVLVFSGIGICTYCKLQIFHEKLLVLALFNSPTSRDFVGLALGS